MADSEVDTAKIPFSLGSVLVFIYQSVATLRHPHQPHQPPHT